MVVIRAPESLDNNRTVLRPKAIHRRYRGQLSGSSALVETLKRPSRWRIPVTSSRHIRRKTDQPLVGKPTDPLRPFG